MNKTNHPILRNSPPSVTANKAIHRLKIAGVLQTQLEHHMILIKYEAVHPIAGSTNFVISKIEHDYTAYSERVHLFTLV